MGAAPAFASASEAMDMVHAGLRFLAAADATGMAAEEQAAWAFGLVVPDHPAGGLRAVRGDAARRCRRDAGGRFGSRCRLVGGDAEDPGELGADTRRRGYSAPDERVG